LIEIKNITKRFGDFIALNNISFTVPEGCIYGIVGSNGAGKSTLLRLITGVYKADGGSVEMNGENIYENPKLKASMQFIPDELYFLYGANMDRMAAMYSAMYESFDYMRYKALAESFGLDRKKAISTFSKGMKRQVTVILALSCHPKFIFLTKALTDLILL